MGNVSSLEQFREIVHLTSKFLVCGTLRADLPYDKVYKVREKNRRLGLGLMGIHEWLLQRGQKYEVTPELHKWLQVYEDESEKAANEHCDRFFISRPVAYRAIAPTGTSESSLRRQLELNRYLRSLINAVSSQKELSGNIPMLLMQPPTESSKTQVLPLTPLTPPTS